MNAQYSFALTDNADCELAFSSFPCQDKVSRSLEEGLEIKEKSLIIEQKKLSVAQESLNVDRQILEVDQNNLKVQEALKEQNDVIIRQNDSAWELARGAEVAFFAIAAPYYTSGYYLHYFSDAVLEARPDIKFGILILSLGLGLALTQINLVDKFREYAEKTTKPSQETKQKSVGALNEKGSNISSLFKMTGKDIIAQTRKFPSRSINRIKKLLEKKL